MWGRRIGTLRRRNKDVGRILGIDAQDAGRKLGMACLRFS